MSLNKKVEGNKRFKLITTDFFKICAIVEKRLTSRILIQVCATSKELAYHAETNEISYFQTGLWQSKQLPHFNLHLLPQGPITDLSQV